MATETFTGTTGAAWPGGWTTFNAATIQSNRGRLADTTSGFATGWWSGSSPVTDFDLTARFATSGSAQVRIGVAATQTINWFVPDNGHIARLYITGSGLDQCQLSSFKAASGTEIDYQAFSAITASGSGWDFRMQREGAVIRARVWPAGTAEPGTWIATATDANPPGTTTDRVWLTASDAGGAGWADFDDVTISPLGGGAAAIPGRRQFHVPRRRAANW